MDPIAERSTISRLDGALETEAPLNAPAVRHSKSNDNTSILKSDLSGLPRRNSNIHDPISTYCAESVDTVTDTTGTDRWADQYSAKPQLESAFNSRSSLALVNNSLDQILYDILLSSQSTIMSALRSAIIEVLKPSLGVSAIHHADLALKTYLDECQKSTLLDSLKEIEMVDLVDLNSLEKKARIQRVIYTSLEDTESMKSSLDDEVRIDKKTIISPAIAIFLKSVLEYIGEQILTAATEITQNNLLSNQLSPQNQIPNFQKTVESLVEANEVDQIAFDTSLNEFWNTWKRLTEPPVKFSSHSFLKIAPFSESLTHLDLAVTKDIFNDIRETEPSTVSPKCKSQSNEAISGNIPLETSQRKYVIFAPNDKQHRLGNTKGRANSAPQASLPPFYTILKRSETSTEAMNENSGQTIEVHNKDEISIELSMNQRMTNHNRSSTASSRDSFSEKEPSSENLTQNDLNRDNHTRVPSASIKPTQQLLPNIEKSELRSSLCRREDRNPLSCDMTHTEKILGTSIRRTKPLPIAHIQPRILSYHEESKGYRSLVKNRPMTWDTSKFSKINISTCLNNQSTISARPKLLKTLTSTDTLDFDPGIFLDKNTSTDELHEDDLFPPNIMETTLPSPKSVSDKRVSATTRYVDTSVQVVDINSLEPCDGCDMNKIKEEIYEATSEPKNYYPPHSNRNVVKSPAEYESDGGISPVSLLNDDIIYDGPVSPVSTVSSMEKTPDQDFMPQLENINLIPSNFISKNHLESTLENHKPKSSNHISKSISSQSKRSTHTSGSTSSSNSHRMKLILKSERDTVGKFDQLIQSDQTLQYTLTPQNVRGIEICDFHQMTIKDNCDSRSNLTNTGISSSSKYVALQTNSIKSNQTSNTICTSSSSAPTSFHSGSNTRQCAPIPRDARVDRDRSLDYLANFIKSTGPELSTTAKSEPSQGAISEKEQSHGSHSTSMSGPRGYLHKRLDSAPSRIKIRHRDPTTKRSDSINDFIDFVRSGPIIEKSNLLFRNPDSSRLGTESRESSKAIENKTIETTQTDPRNRQNPPSINSSVTSHSALLINSSKTKQTIPKSKDKSVDASTVPVRTRPKIHDPYSFDFSDEEDENDLLQSKPKLSESLTDFLRNTSPENYPPNNDETVKTTKISLSAPGLISLFGKSLSNTPSSLKNTSSSISSHQSEALSSKIRKRINAHPTPLSSKTSQPQIPRTEFSQKCFEPREPTYSTVRTNDLAQFLMYNEPPQTETKDLHPSNFNMVQKKEINSFHKMFGRKKTKTISRT
ncbi:hypothetical protein GcM3_199028 [Golovinomyces cichoracearum]|uniref:Uncharacterized protein n=1 Tax=Golovinomyces cichoracearum TaxID=62708 RepID=A0A420HER6_9PEZI|nr:hypothetical protein GcM3_199028 [Golovinomyces cichoracearum]